jgi:hypothetical protein
MKVTVINNVVGGNIIENFLIGCLGFLSTNRLEQIRMLQYQVVLDVRQLGGRFNCQSKQ